MAKKIKTYLKFQRSNRDNVTFVAFVRKERGSWRGCHETDGCKKKIVLADIVLAETLLDGVLYSTHLVPMKERMGFVAISAEPVKFAARINTIVDDDKYVVEVKFGNKTIVFDPSSPLESHRSIDSVVKTLSKRIDIKNPEKVICDFKESAEIVSAYYRADHPEQK